MLLAFRTAERSHEDAETLQILDMILDNATAGLINLNLNQQQKVREAGSYPYLLNDYGAQYLWGIPKQDQTLEEVEALLLEQIDLIKQGQFDDWIIPAIVTDFKKSVKQGLENNNSRVGFMRDAYLGFEEWSHAVRALDRMAELEKHDIVKAANKVLQRRVCRWLPPRRHTGHTRDRQATHRQNRHRRLAPIDLFRRSHGHAL